MKLLLLREYLRCNYCGQFLNHGYIYTPWGSCEDLEPPEDRFVCEKCYTPRVAEQLSKMWHPAIRFNWKEDLESILDPSKRSQDET